MAKVPLITKANVNIEVLKYLKKRFHLNALKYLVKNNYIGEDVLEQVNKCIDDLGVSKGVNHVEKGKRQACTRPINSYLQPSDDTSSTNLFSSDSNSYSGSDIDSDIDIESESG